MERCAAPSTTRQGFQWEVGGVHSSSVPPPPSSTTWFGWNDFTWLLKVRIPAAFSTLHLPWTRYFILDRLLLTLQNRHSFIVLLLSFSAFALHIATMKFPAIALIGIVVSCHILPSAHASTSSSPLEQHDESSLGLSTESSTNDRGYLRSLQSSGNWPQCGTPNDCQAVTFPMQNEDAIHSIFICI